MIFFYFFLISISLIGYGLIFSKIFSLKINNLGIIGLLGIVLISALSYLFSPFFIHSYHFNLTFLLIGITFLLINLKIFYSLKRDLLYYVLIFLPFIFFIIIGKSHDDFPYYHFPYSFFLTEFTHPIGFGKLNEGFRSPSSIFFINSMFYLPKISFYSFNFTQAFIMFFANIFFLKIIFDQKVATKSFEISLLALIIFSYVNIFFYRLSEHGTDRSAMILIFICVLYLMILMNSYNNIYTKDYKEDLFKKFSILIVFITTIKPFYIIYLSLFIILIICKNTREIFFKNIFSKVIVFCVLIFSLSIFYTFINSGCLIFPLSFSCFYNFEWSLSKKIIQDINVWFELWSKAGASPNYVVDDPKNYIKNFNWLDNWLTNYFFNKVSDYLLGLTLLIMIIFYTFKENKNRPKIKVNYLILYIFIIILFLEWLLNHPQLRYGGYHLIALLFFIPFIYFFSEPSVTTKILASKSKVIISISIIIFIGRNIDRLTNEFKLNNYNPLKNSKFLFIGGNQEFYFRYNDLMKKNQNDYKFLKVLSKKIYIIQ